MRKDKFRRERDLHQEVKLENGSIEHEIERALDRKKKNVKVFYLL